MVVSDAHVEAEAIDYPLPDGTICDGRPTVLLELCDNFNIVSTICNLFLEMWRITEMDI
jgi:hypothetical protein